LIWLAGSALVLLNAKVRINSARISVTMLPCSFVLLMASLFASRSLSDATLPNDLTVGFAFALFLFAVLQSTPGKGSPRGAAVAHHLAGFSYSLYVLHFPLLLFLRCWLAPIERWQPTPAHLLLIGLVGIGCLLFAWLISLFTEKKTDVARRKVKRLFA